MRLRGAARGAQMSHALSSKKAKPANIYGIKIADVKRKSKSACSDWHDTGQIN
jgi:hypothetical protein